MAVKDITVDFGGSGTHPFLEDVVQVYQKGDNWVPQETVDGIASRTLQKTLARNALVRRFEVRVGAVRADATNLANSGQVRLALESGGSKFVIVDFGMLRTISAVGVAIGGGGPTISVCRVYPWLGADFSPTHIYFQDCEATDPDAMMVVPAESNLFEVRTERVKLKLKTTAELTEIANRVFLEFPDLPSDVEIRVNNLPAWSSPGAVQPNARGWSADAEQQVDLTAALATITGDPTDEAALPIDIVFTSRVPGVLTLEEVTTVTDVSYLHRVLFDGEADKVIEFTAEGVEDVVVPLPAWADKLEEIRLTLTGTPPEERILPPVGPEVATLPASSVPLADLMLDIDHAGAARLPAGTGLTELTGVRLPLGAGADGAEARVVIYEGTLQSPVSSVAAASSTPVALAPNFGATDDVWTTFTFPEPIALAPELTYWAVIAVSRGTVAWNLGQFPTEPETIALRRGILTGPWHTLPTVLPGVHVGARIREIGHASKEEPIAPLILNVVGAVPGGEMSVTPKPKGTAIVWTPTALGPATPRPRLIPAGSGTSKSITLRLTSRMIGRVTLSQVDLVATKLPS